MELLSRKNIPLGEDTDLVITVDDEYFAEARRIGGVVRKLDLASFPRRVDDVADARRWRESERENKNRVEVKERRGKEGAGGGGRERGWVRHKIQQQHEVKRQRDVRGEGEAEEVHNNFGFSTVGIRPPKFKEKA